MRQPNTLKVVKFDLKLSSVSIAIIKIQHKITQTCTFNELFSKYS